MINLFIFMVPIISSVIVRLSHFFYLGGKIMALFKILRGESANLADNSVTDGFAYFTPEDGKFILIMELLAMNLFLVDHLLQT